jgi:hypothetical protein
MNGAIKLTSTEVEDFLLGAGFLASGGGGGESYARFFLLDEIQSCGDGLTLVDFAELPEAELVFRPFFLGSQIHANEIQAFLERTTPEASEYRICLAHADELLRRHLGRSPVAYLPAEIGPTNTMAAMYLAARAGSMTIDADCAGRAIPEVCLDLPSQARLPVTPFAMATEFGDRLLVHAMQDADRMELVGRQLARSSGGIVAIVQACFVRDLRKSVVRGSVRRAIEIGRDVRTSLEAEKPPLERLIGRGAAVRLFHGRIVESQSDSRDGFVTGEHLLRACECGNSATARIWFKNENLVMWKNGVPYMTCPDIVTLVDPATGRPLFNDQNDHSEGREVVVLGLGCDPVWRHNGHRLNPRHFGFPFDSIGVWQAMIGEGHLYAGS